jgi:hypothetical protein
VLAWRRGQRFSVWLNLGDQPREIQPGPGTAVATTRRGARVHPAVPARTGFVHDADTSAAWLPSPTICANPGRRVMAVGAARGLSASS